MTLKNLWYGHLPLREAFWTHAVVYAAFASMSATITSYILIAQGQAALLAMAVGLLPIPYIVATWVGVQRSAAHYDGPRHWAGLARHSASVWAIAMVFL